MSVTPRLAAFDLDGTLLNSRSEISAHTRSVLVELAGSANDADRHFIVATGRGYDSAAERLRDIEPIRWLISDNGATMYDLHHDELVAHDAIEPAAATAFVERLRDRLPGVALGWGSLSTGFAWTTDFAAIFGVDPAERRVVDADQPIPVDAVKVLLTHGDHSADELLAMIADLPTDGLAVTTSGLSFVEMTAAGIDKSVRLAQLCQQLGVDRQHTVAFGDAMNDHAMLQWVGTGYAMANAHPEVKAAANAITERSNDDDGVAHTLQAIFSPPST